MYKYLFTLGIICLSLFSCTQSKPKTVHREVKEKPSKYSSWTLLTKGIEYIEMKAPQKSFLGDSKLSILRIQPEFLQFFMYNATQNKKAKLTASQLADSFDLNIVMNAGMYDMANGLIHRGYSRNGKHFNNRKLNPDYNSMLAFSPKDSSISNFDILDLECQNWREVRNLYNCYAQGMRMIDCNGEPLSWNKHKQTCSMLVAAKDKSGRIWFIFTRSPYSHTQMIQFMKSFKEGLQNAIYLEGGPETSFYISVGEHHIEKVGSYVSDLYPRDTNVDFWPLPNLIGVKSID
jgi:hypothetical protein